jgi:hypothetical protein
MKKKTAKFKEVPVEQLRWRCDPDTLGFKTTDDIITCPDIIGQREIHQRKKNQFHGPHDSLPGQTGKNYINWLKMKMKNGDCEYRRLNS